VCSSVIGANRETALTRRRIRTYTFAHTSGDSMGNERKERVIHTRVPESLDDEIKRSASNLGLSVSNLVRNVLQNAFGLVEDIVSDSADIARSARGASAAFERTRRARPAAAAPRILGWHLALLNVNAVCEACNAVLPKGTQAGVAVTEGPGARPFRCAKCLQELSDANDEPPTE
jgi:predicted DNA binding CopG/RHH family protein